MTEPKIVRIIVEDLTELGYAEFGNPPLSVPEWYKCCVALTTNIDLIYLVIGVGMTDGITMIRIRPTTSEDVVTLPLIGRLTLPPSSATAKDS